MPRASQALLEAGSRACACAIFLDEADTLFGSSLRHKRHKESRSSPPATPTTQEPSPQVVNLAGSWTGTLESSNFPSHAITMTIVQAAALSRSREDRLEISTS
jgi:hypothetical protein